jgi:hypothetical protein
VTGSSPGSPSLLPPSVSPTSLFLFLSLCVSFCVRVCVWRGGDAHARVPVHTRMRPRAQTHWQFLSVETCPICSPTGTNFLILHALIANRGSAHALRYEGCLTNFLPSPWQQIKWRLPQINLQPSHRPFCTSAAWVINIRTATCTCDSTT